MSRRRKRNAKRRRSARTTAAPETQARAAKRQPPRATKSASPLVGGQGEAIFLLVTAAVGAGGFIFLPPWQALALLCVAALVVAIFRPFRPRARLSVFAVAVIFAFSAFGAWRLAGDARPSQPVTREELAAEIQRLLTEISRPDSSASQAAELKTGRLRLAMVAYLNSLRMENGTAPLYHNPETSHKAQRNTDYLRDVGDGLAPPKPPPVTVRLGARGLVSINVNGPAEWKPLVDDLLDPNRKPPDKDPETIEIFLVGQAVAGDVGPPPALLSPKLTEIGIGISSARSSGLTYLGIYLAGYDQ
jgi:hypothetical protein